MQFKYEATNNRDKTIKGLVQATDRAEAISLVEDKGLSVVNMTASKAKGGAIRIGFLEKITIKDLVGFYRQLAMMISSDIPIVQSLKILSNQDLKNLKMHDIMVDLYENVSEGMKFSDVMAKYSDVFGDFYIYMIKSGEASGKFNEVLEYLADQQEKDYAFRAKLKGALSYPMFILSALFLMGLGMMVFVIPKLTAMLLESGISLPLSTRILILISDITKNFWYLIIGGVIGGITGLKLFIKKTEFGKKWFDFLILKIPRFGSSLVQKTYLVRLTKSMSLLVIGGVQLTEAIDITASVVGNYHYYHMLKETSAAVKDGNQIASVFAKHPELVPDMLTQLTIIGEQTGKIDQVFEKIGDFYAKEVSTLVDNISKMIEPVIMVIMGMAVGFLVISIMVPMFKASQAV